MKRKKTKNDIDFWGALEPQNDEDTLVSDKPLDCPYCGKKWKEQAYACGSDEGMKLPEGEQTEGRYGR